MRIALKMSAALLVESLSTGLYESHGQRLMELVRNGVAASMRSPNRWEPGRAHIEISLVPRHCLSPRNGPALIVLDHGCGLTDEALDRYCGWLGPSMAQVREREQHGYSGVSQKGIGRLAALALNENCTGTDPARVRHGFHILSRTADIGAIRSISFIPEEMEKAGGSIDTTRTVSPSAPEMQAISAIRGSFTAIVIPTPIFKSYDEIREAIKWLIPRQQDKMFVLEVGGKVLLPPPLEDELTLASEDRLLRAHIGTAQKGAEHGLFLCDAETGLRVASCVALRAHLPEPLWFPDLVGDIFAPGLLRHQNTARSTLAREFFRRDNKDWGRLQMFLIREVVPLAQGLVKRDAIHGEAAEALEDVAELFNSHFGPAEGGDLLKFRQKARKKTSTDPQQEPDDGDPESEERRPYRRFLTIKVRDEVWALYRGVSLGEFTFAEVERDGGRILSGAGAPRSRVMKVNVRGNYKALPKTKLAQREHILMQILTAIGMDATPDDPAEGMRFANAVRSELLGA